MSWTAMASAARFLTSDAADKREFCTGLGCISGMGVPVSAASAVFSENCVQLTDVVAGGMKTDPTTGTTRLPQAQANFASWCSKRLPAKAAPKCADGGEYNDVLVMSLSAVASEPAVGDVCAALQGWFGVAKAAEAKLGLTEESLPADAVKKSVNSKPMAPGKLPWWEGKDPKNYVPNPPCETASAQYGAKSYLIREGFEIGGNLYEHCTTLFAEIFASDPLTGAGVAEKTRSWCRWKAAAQQTANKHVKDPADKVPEWSSRDCNGMMTFVAFGVRHHLDVPVSPAKTCELMFIAQSVTN
eukprot:CAMPEP_0179007682 /NCGR_PEP_ID=MMETSP0795-20121207/15294_1 /TAXON_ID=88552 /ORGANISM="Amoebophrya sp., Strain Ameob2" /LENGTH=299 /DNA_ID=CAMNT_0020702679 /DNA_START=210 /DNA_END=1106 /DNA_ORIENTATION=+